MPEEKKSSAVEREIEINDAEASESADAKASDEEVSAEADVSENEEAVEAPLEPTPEERIAELEDKLLRNVAEFENYKKRMARQYDSMMSSVTDRVLNDLLEVVDNFERALASANEKSDAKAVLDGTRMIYQQMVQLLERYQVKPFDSVGKKFDPDRHEALMQMPSDEHEEGIVAAEIVRGYTKGAQVFRHAKVGVSSGSAGSDGDSESDEK